MNYREGDLLISEDNIFIILLTKEGIVVSYDCIKAKCIWLRQGSIGWKKGFIVYFDQKNLVMSSQFKKINKRRSK